MTLIAETLLGTEAGKVVSSCRSPAQIIHTRRTLTRGDELVLTSCSQHTADRAALYETSSAPKET